MVIYMKHMYWLKAVAVILVFTACLRLFCGLHYSLRVPQIYGDMWAKLQRAVAIWSGFGMTLTGVHTCGDYMFSGHTVVLTMLNFFVTECECAEAFKQWSCCCSKTFAFYRITFLLVMM